ncbi:bacteriohemerythrin [Hydrogenophaga sp. RAC07]|uniref:bacteriohemerythrin n=1 Tax=Hydrogenophaga sp. RAC07 TaxID=1842537 RepID=UPI0009F6CF63|nr:hemerythrin domain-containing protein [Hydrogenophaga sp. RAC07]
MQTASHLPAIPLVWNDSLLLGYDPMDASHREFVEVVTALMNATDDQLGASLELVERHLLDHFNTEDRWMAETDYPARECHANEHAAVLRSLLQVKELWSEGDAAIVRRFGSELCQWFPGHADYLDSALSHWMSKIRMGGKPVVVRRKLSFAEHAISETK